MKIQGIYSAMVALLLAFPVISQADDKAAPKYSVEEIMKALHKGEDSVGKKVLGGKGTKQDFDKLVEYYASLPLNEAPAGDPASWKQKTTAVLAAAQALKEGKPGALGLYVKAVNCKDCHDLHRPKD